MGQYWCLSVVLGHSFKTVDVWIMHCIMCLFPSKLCVRQSKPLNNLNKLQNRAARIVCDTRSQHISSLQQLHHLHWLPVRSRIQFKLSTWCFWSWTLNQPLHMLHSLTQDLLTVPRCKTMFGSYRFSVAAPRVWNSLPQELRKCETRHF